jgi:hypothetical protein
LDKKCVEIPKRLDGRATQTPSFYSGPLTEITLSVARRTGGVLGYSPYAIYWRMLEVVANKVENLNRIDNQIGFLQMGSENKKIYNQREN